MRSLTRARLAAVLLASVVAIGVPSTSVAASTPVRSGTIVGGVFTTGPSADCSFQPDCRAWLESDCHPALAERDPAWLASIVNVSDLGSKKTRVFAFSYGQPAGVVAGGVVVQFWSKRCHYLDGWSSMSRVTWYNARTKIFKFPTGTHWMTVSASDNLHLSWTLR